MLSAPPTIVPSSANCGRSGTGGGGGGLRMGGGGGGATTTTGGGRREDEKIGRSRVTVKLLSGTAHKGLPRRGALPSATPGDVISDAPSAACTMDMSRLA